MGTIPIVPFGEWRPDVADYEGQHSKTITNAVPQGDGYGPFPEFGPPFNGALESTASMLPLACRGAFLAIKPDGGYAVFAATFNNLYKYSVATLTSSWASVSSTAGYTSLGSGANWQFSQFNNYVVAVSTANAPQVYDLRTTSTSTTFSNLGGSPPTAGSIAVVNRFLVMTGIASPNAFRVQWSGIDAPTQWTSGVQQSDYQDLTDGGKTVAVIGGAQSGIVFQDTAIKRMNFAPGSPFVFEFEPISDIIGLYKPYAACNAGDRTFFLSQQGFKMLLPGGYPQHIGKEKVDRTFFDEFYNSSNKNVVAVPDPVNNRVYWTYPTTNAVSNWDTILSYDYALDRWTKISASGEYLFYGTKDIVNLVGGNYDAPIVSGFSSSHNIGVYSSTAGSKAATLISAQHGAGDGRRIFVRGMRVVSDVSSSAGMQAAGSVAETLKDTETYQTLTSPSTATGFVGQRYSTRYTRAKVTIPANTSSTPTWTYASGVEVDATVEGER